MNDGDVTRRKLAEVLETNKGGIHKSFMTKAFFYLFFVFTTRQFLSDETERKFSSDI